MYCPTTCTSIDLGHGAPNKRTMRWAYDQNCKWDGESLRLYQEVWAWEEWWLFSVWQKLASKNWRLCTCVSVQLWALVRTCNQSEPWRQISICQKRGHRGGDRKETLAGGTENGPLRLRSGVVWDYPSSGKNQGKLRTNHQQLTPDQDYERKWKFVSPDSSQITRLLQALCWWFRRPTFCRQVPNRVG